MPKEREVKEGPSTAPDPVEKLWKEYAECNAAYNSRDVIAEDEFSKLIQSFSIFAAVLIATNALKLEVGLKYPVIIILGVFGALAFLSLVLDMEGACSCKVAVRQRAQAIEAILADRGEGPLIWNAMDDRSVFLEEKILKIIKVDAASEIVPLLARSQAREKETEGALFVWSGRLMILLWIALVIIILVAPVRG